MRTAARLIAGFLLLSGTVAGAGLATERVTLRVSTIVVPPLVVHDRENNRLSGTALDAVRALANRCGADVDFIITPSWNRAYMMAQLGIADGVIPTNFSEERLAYFDFPSEPLVDMKPSLIVRIDSPAKRFSGLDILKGKRIGVRTNALLEKDFDAYVRSNKATLVERSDSVSLVDELLSGRVDFIADSSAMIVYHLTRSKIPERIRVLEPPLGASGQFLALSKKRSASFAPETDLSHCLLTTPPPTRPQELN